MQRPAVMIIHDDNKNLVACESVKNTWLQVKVLVPHVQLAEEAKFAALWIIFHYGNSRISIIAIIIVVIIVFIIIIMFVNNIISILIVDPTQVWKHWMKLPVLSSASRAAPCTIFFN